MKDMIEWESGYKFIAELGIRGYQQKYFKECKYIWKHMIPERGQADTVQGELLREVEKLRYEACNNGNRNWDDNFAWFCENIYDILSGSGSFRSDECKVLKEILHFIQSNGEYARAYEEGKITEEECDPIKLAYAEDDLYDFLADAVARFYLANKKPLPYERKEFIYR